MADFSNSDTIAISAGVIALAALGVSIWQGYISREHNKLSVRPHLEFILHCKTTEDFRLILRNSGLGPALISKISLFVDNKEFVFNDSDTANKFFEKLAPQNAGDFSYYIADQRSAISSDKFIRVFIFNESTAAKNPQLNNYLRNMQSRISAKVEYKCMYGRAYSAAFTC